MATPSSWIRTLALISVGLSLTPAIAHAQEGWPTVDDPDQVFLYPEGESSPASDPDEPVLIYPESEDGVDGMPESLSDTPPPPPPPSIPPTAAGSVSDPSEAPASLSVEVEYPVAAIEIDGVSPELEDMARRLIQIQPGQTVTDFDLQADLDAILSTGFFADGNARTVVQAGGAVVRYDLEPVVVRSLDLAGASALTQETADMLFRTQLNQSISPRRLEQGSFGIDQWYLENGYALSQVVGLIPDASGVLTVEVMEPQVNQITIRYIDDTGSSVDEDGEPIEGRTREEFVQRELQVQPGDVFNQNEVVQDLRHLMSLGLFNDANVEIDVDEESEAVPVVDVTYSLQEQLSRSFQASGGVSTELGLFAGLNYRDNNVQGQGNSLRLGTQVGNRGLVFNTGFTRPYRDSRPNQLGYDISAFRRTGQSLTFSDEVAVANGDDARERQFGGGVAVMRPVGEWDAELGLNYTRTSIRDQSGDLAPEDELGNALTISDSGIDDLFTLGFQVAQDRRVNPSNPSGGSILSLGTEQSLPLGRGNILMNRLRANYAEYVPVSLFNTGRLQNPEVFAFNLQAGTIIGDLPPYEAFDLGGSQSVRGYARGDVGSGRHYVLAAAEYRFPVVGPLGAVLFTDFASDLGSGSAVPGDPAGARDKPGTGFGYGLGFRVGSPIGLIRADFGFNDQGENQFHFGFGQRF